LLTTYPRKLVAREGEDDKFILVLPLECIQPEIVRVKPSEGGDVDHQLDLRKRKQEVNSKKAGNGMQHFNQHGRIKNFVNMKHCSRCGAKII
jgi:hypothetical protein